jgi:hypothetical protein
MRTDGHDETNSRFSKFCERALKKTESRFQVFGTCGTVTVAVTVAVTVTVTVTVRVWQVLLARLHPDT